MEKRTEERISRMAKRYGYSFNEFVGLMIESFNRQDRILREIFQLNYKDNITLRDYISRKKKLKK